MIVEIYVIARVFDDVLEIESSGLEHVAYAVPGVAKFIFC